MLTELPISWPSDFDAAPIPAAIVDFRPIEPLFDTAFSDEEEAGGGEIFLRMFFVRSQVLGAGPGLNSPPERPVRVKRHPNCSSGAQNIVRCNFYDADLLLLSGESWNDSSNHTQPGQNPPVPNHQTPGISSISPFQSSIEIACGTSSLACYNLLFPNNSDIPEVFASPDPAETSVGVAPSSVDTVWTTPDPGVGAPDPLNLDTLPTPADPGLLPAAARGSSAYIMIMIGFGFLALAGWKSRLRTI